MTFAEGIPLSARHAPVAEIALERGRIDVDGPTALASLLFAARGEPELPRRPHTVQEEATAIAALLAAEPQLRDAPDLLLLAEFVKRGMHGLAEWWEHHPTTRATPSSTPSSRPPGPGCDPAIRPDVATGAWFQPASGSLANASSAGADGTK